jgi:hypothetical protein
MVTSVKPAIHPVDRRTEVSSVLASFRMEGLEPDAETARLLQQYAAGALSIEQLGSAIERRVAGADVKQPAEDVA